MNKIIRIGNKSIGLDNPVFIIAEAGVNHNGNVNLAKHLMNKDPIIYMNWMQLQIIQLKTSEI